MWCSLCCNFKRNRGNVKLAATEKGTSHQGGRVVYHMAGNRDEGHEKEQERDKEMEDFPFLIAIAGG